MSLSMGPRGGGGTGAGASGHSRAMPRGETDFARAAIMPRRPVDNPGHAVNKFPGFSPSLRVVLPVRSVRQRVETFLACQLNVVDL